MRLQNLLLLIFMLLIATALVIVWVSEFNLPSLIIIFPAALAGLGYFFISRADELETEQFAELEAKIIELQAAIEELEKQRKE